MTSTSCDVMKLDCGALWHTPFRTAGGWHALTWPGGSRRRSQVSALAHQAFDPIQVVHEEGTVAAAPRDALRAAEVDVHVVRVRLHVPRRRDDRVGVVAAELGKQWPATRDARCTAALPAVMCIAP